MSSGLLGRWNDSDYSLTEPEKSKWSRCDHMQKASILLNMRETEGEYNMEV